MTSFVRDVATCGVLSGAIGCTIPYPFDVVRTRQQANVTNEVRVTRAAWNIWKSSGFLHLFKGYSCSILFYCPASAIYYCAYEYSRHRIKRSYKSCSDPILECISGFVANTTGMLLWTPMDNIAQKCQCGDKSDTPRKVTRQILQQEGFHGFYRGFSASALSLGPQCALFWGLYESSRRSIQFGEESTLTQLICATFAATGSVFLTNPIDVVRCQIQTDQSDGRINRAARKSIARAVRTVAKNEGLMNMLFKGLRARCLVVVPDFVAGIVSFEFAFQKLTGSCRSVSYDF